MCIRAHTATPAAKSYGAMPVADSKSTHGSLTCKGSAGGVAMLNWAGVMGVTGSPPYPVGGFTVG
eukprot:3017934-Amphidinium_carterae.1